MSNYITVSTIGVLPEKVDLSASFAGIAEKMMAFLDGQIRQVLPDSPDLIVLPEVCGRVADMPYEQLMDFCASCGHLLLNFMCAQAKENHCYIAYPTIEFDTHKNRKYNCCHLIDRSGKVIGTYRKRHLTIYEMQDLGISCGDGPVIFECDFGRVGCAICFDLNFESLVNEYAKRKPDLILFPSMFHGGIMQNWWAYKCRCHFVSAIGSPGLFSEIRNPHGVVLASSTNYKNYTTAKINLDCCLVHLDYHFDKLPKLKEKYKSDVRIEDPGRFGSVLVSSHHAQLTVRQMLSEFEIEPLDDYLKRSALLQDKNRKQ